MHTFSHKEINTIISNALNQTSRVPERRRSFGSVNNHLRNFLIVIILMIVRALIKKDPHNVSSDLSRIEYASLSALTSISLFEILRYLVGPAWASKIFMAYLVFTLGYEINQVRHI